MDKYLIITSAICTPHECEKIFGCSYQDRINEYLECFESIKKFKDQFKDIIILETIGNDIGEFNEHEFTVHYSKEENFFINKGLNETNHISKFLVNNLKPEDVFVKITGRYTMTNDNLLKKIDNSSTILAKHDRDIYGGKGVHTFYFACRKDVYQVFHSYLTLDFSIRSYKEKVCIEWDMKEFMKKHNYDVLSFRESIGARTKTYYLTNGKVSSKMIRDV